MTVLVILLLPALHVLSGGLANVFSYLAADSFYYMTVAVNAPGSHTFTFDQQLPTNGFHPLWQWLLAAAAWLLHTPDREFFIWVTFGISALFCGVGAFLTITVAAPFLRWASVLLAIFPLGLYGAFIAPAYPRFSTIWTQMNGMESGVSFLMFALFFRHVVFGRSATVAGILLGAVVLARLDSIFLVPAFLLVEAAAGMMRFRRLWNAALARCLIVGAIVSFVVCAYLLINYSYCGMIAPVSGRSKSSFPHITVNISTVWDMLTGTDYPDAGRTRRYRIAQLFLPPVLAAAYLVVVSIRIGLQDGAKLFVGANSTARFRRFMVSAALFVIVLHSYNILFVPLEAQGEWYFYLSQVIVTLCGCDALRMLPWSNTISGIKAQRAILAAVLVADAICFVTGFWLAQQKQPKFYTTFRDRDAFSAHYNGRLPHMLEFDDGIVAYSTSAPAISGFGFCVDRETATAYRHGRILSHAFSRGYDRICSCYYMKLPDYVKLGDDVTTNMLQRDWPVNFAGYRYYADYVPEHRSYFVVRMQPW